MRINSIIKSDQYNLHKESSNKYENKRREKSNEQGILFSDILEGIRNSSNRTRK